MWIVRAGYGYIPKIWHIAGKLNWTLQYDFNICDINKGDQGHYVQTVT